MCLPGPVLLSNHRPPSACARAIFHYYKSLYKALQRLPPQQQDPDCSANRPYLACPRPCLQRCKTIVANMGAALQPRKTIVGLVGTPMLSNKAIVGGMAMPLLACKAVVSLVEKPLLAYKNGQAHRGGSHIFRQLGANPAKHEPLSHASAKPEITGYEKEF